VSLGQSRPSRPIGSFPLVLCSRRADAEPPHFVVESGPRHPEAGGSAGDYPVGLAKNAKDVGAFGFLERNRLGGSFVPQRHEFRLRRFKHLPARENHGALDEVLKLPNVSGPGMLHESSHDF